MTTKHNGISNPAGANAKRAEGKDRRRVRRQRLADKRAYLIGA